MQEEMMPKNLNDFLTYAESTGAAKRSVLKPEKAYKNLAFLNSAEARPVRGVITGVAGAWIIARVFEEAGMEGVEVVVAGNRLLGGSVTVSALLGGRDIADALAAVRPAAREMLIPESMLREGLFIDDMSVADVERETGYGIIPVAVDGAAFLAALCGEEG